MVNSVIIASNANFLIDILRDKLREISYRVYSASTDIELNEKIKEVYPRFIFLEHCFHGYGTDSFIQTINKHYPKKRIIVWAVTEVKPLTAARYIAAGADSFIPLRDECQSIKNILYQITEGRSYYPADVETVINRECAFPVVGKELTNREIQIAKLLIRGKRNLDICKILALTIHTVKRHKLRIYQKYSVDNPIDILRIAFRHGVLSFEEFLFDEF
jgi:DNA-binding NarL/FixJ family response regulator